MKEKVYVESYDEEAWKGSLTTISSPPPGIIQSLVNLMLYEKELYEVKEKVLSKEKIIPLKPPIKPMCWHEAFDSHDRTIARLLALNENIVSQMEGMKKNMDDMNDVVKGITKLIDGINGILRTIITQLPKWDGDV